MDIEHHNQKLQIDGKLHLCPLPEHPEEILDLGTGTGIWAIEMGMKQLPHSVGGTVKDFGRWLTYGPLTQSGHAPRLPGLWN